jgi:hypothetical protein
VSAVADAAHVTLILADYAVFDAAGKLNLVGGIWVATQAIPTPLGPGLPEQHVVAIIDIPQDFAGEQVAVTLALRDPSGEPVRAPIASAGEEPQYVRVAQVATIEKPRIPGVQAPKELSCRINVQMGLPLGLPLEPGNVYSWTVHIDDVTRPEWSTPFYLVGLPTGPVWG